MQILWVGFCCCAISLANAKTIDTALLSELLPQQCVFAGEFTQSRTLQNIPVPLISSGKLFFSCDGGLIWQTNIPITETLVYSKQKHYFQIQDDGQVQGLKTRVHAYLAQVLLSLMGADIEQLQQNFVVSDGVEEVSVEKNQTKESNKQSMTAVLQPRNKRFKKFLREIVLVHKDDIRTIEMINVDGQTTLVEISQPKYFDEPVDVLSSCREFLGQQDKACDVLIHHKNYQSKNYESKDHQTKDYQAKNQQVEQGS